jgi:hypothetical protein
MEILLIVVLVIVLLVRWAILSDRYREMERRIDELAGLSARVRLLEEQIDLLTRGRAPVAQEPVPETPVVVPTIAPVVAPPPAPAIERVLPPPLPNPKPTPAPPVVVEPPRPSRTSEEWEALVGGSWLNKLGVLVLVIAIALFLAYSLTQFGPAGRSAIGLAVSVAMLACGAIVERRPTYVIFARGLLAGGWAGLYFTTYAMQALDAAKVIDSPLLGGALQLAVAAGMVWHSMRYRAPMVTGLAYAAAFGALVITPLTAFSTIALAPLAASLLVVAYRFEWPGMALFGLAATYVTCASRGDSGAPLWMAQTVFAVYWVLFEAYDLWRARRRSDHPAERALLPLNALGLGLLSYAKWSAAAPDDLYLLAMGAAAAYLATTILRAVLRPPASFAAEKGTLTRILAGGFEGPITLAAACSAAAAVLKLHGQSVNYVLLVEGELLFLAALFFRESYPRRLAAAVFAALGVKLLSTDIPTPGTVELAGHVFKDWTPTGALAALVFYGNLVLHKASKGYGYAASALVALILGFEVPADSLGTAWLAFGALLFFLGWRERRFDFRLQSYAVGALALGAIAWHQLAGPLALAAVAAYAAAMCAVRSPSRFADAEREPLQFVASLVASAACVDLIWKTVPDLYWGPAWMVLALVLLELGLRGWPADFFWHAPLVGLLGAACVWFFTVQPLHPIVLTRERVAIACAALAAYAFAVRVKGADRRTFHAASAVGSLFVLVELWALVDAAMVAPAWALFALAVALLPDLRWHSYVLAALAFVGALNMEFSAPHVFATAFVTAVLFAMQFVAPGGRLFCSLLASVLATALLYQEVSGSMLTVAWGTEGAVLLGAGFLLRDRGLRLQGMALFLICTGKLFFYDLRALETLYRILSFFVLGMILVGVSWVYTRFRDQLQRYL